MHPEASIHSPVVIVWIFSFTLGIVLLLRTLSRFFDRKPLLIAAFMILAGTNLIQAAILEGPNPLALFFDGWLILVLAANRIRTANRYLRGGLLTILVLLAISLVILEFSIPLDQLPSVRHEVFIGSLYPRSPQYLFLAFFSWQNGWLIYTPMMIVCFAGFWFLAERSAKLFLATFPVVILSLIFTGGNPKWYFPAGFSYPALAALYGLLAIPLAALTVRVLAAGRPVKIMFFTIAGLLIILNIFQTWQFNRQIISPGRMTGAYYRSVFCKPGAGPAEKALLARDPDTQGDLIPDELNQTGKTVVSLDFEKTISENDPCRTTDFAYTGKYSFCLGGPVTFSPGLRVPFSGLDTTGTGWIRVTGYFYYTCNPATNKVMLVMTGNHSGTAFKYRITDMARNCYAPNRWNCISMSYLLPKPLDPADMLQVYFWNYGAEKCYLDDLNISLYKSPATP